MFDIKILHDFKAGTELQIFHNFIVLHLSTKKTKPNLEIWPESLGVMLDF